MTQPFIKGNKKCRRISNVLLGYIRVSSKAQNTERQYTAFTDYGQANNTKIERIFEDKTTGKTFNRDGYNALKMTLRKGATLIIKELDHLGRDMEQIKKSGVKFRIWE